MLQIYFSQNTTNLLSIVNVATCYELQSQRQANHWNIFKVYQVKVHVFGIPKSLQKSKSVNTGMLVLF
jgi:hypothetical protein